MRSELLLIKMAKLPITYMPRPLFGTKITGIVLLAVGIMMISIGIFLHFVIPLVLQNMYLLDDGQQIVAKELLSGAIGSIVVGGLIALGITDIIISLGLIKQKKWALKALTLLTIICVLLNIITAIKLPNIANLTLIIGGGIADGMILFYLYKKNKKELASKKEQALIG